MTTYTANELYEMTPVSSCNHIGELCGFYYDHLPEVHNLEEVDRYSVSSDRISVKTIKDICYDGERVWQLRSVWFDGTPFMVVQNAGRGGDDHSERFITNTEVFEKFIGIVNTLVMELLDKPQFKPCKAIDPCVKLKELTHFYSDYL